MSTRAADERIRHAIPNRRRRRQLRPTRHAVPSSTSHAPTLKRSPPGRRLQRQPGLADAADSGQRDQPRRRQHVLHRGELGAATSETRQLQRQIPETAANGWGGLRAVLRHLVDGHAPAYLELSEFFPQRGGRRAVVPVAVLNPPAMWAIPKSLSAGSPKSVSRMLAGDVSVQDPHAVRGIERADHLHTEPEHLQRQQTEPTDPCLSEPCRWYCMTRYGYPLGFPDLQHAHDVRMSGEPAHRPLLAQELVVVLVEFGGEDFDRHGAVQIDLGTPVDDPKPPRPISCALSNPAARNSVTTAEPTSRCVWNGSLSIIGILRWGRA